MELYNRTDIKPTWEILKFDDQISGIPCESKEYGEGNPLDKNIAVRFRPDTEGKYVYYLPKTNSTQSLEQHVYDTRKLSKLFGTEVKAIHVVKENQSKCVRPFMYEMILGDCYVFRRFEIAVFCDEISAGNYKCGVSPAKEVCRYVFHDDSVFIEKRDKTRTVIAVEKIMSDDAYDTLQDAKEVLNDFLYQSFLRDVKIVHQEAILRALSFVKKNYPKLGFKAFLEIYARAIEDKPIDKSVPKRIIRELNGRSHITNTAVRIEKDLVVVTGENECQYLDVREPVRIYFDGERGYCFRKNVITGEWMQDDLLNLLSCNCWIREMVIDKDIFDNTCMEKYAKYAVMKNIPTGGKIDFSAMIAQANFLSAEQAAKTEINIYPLILENIYEGMIKDRNKSLPELLGISGSQLKFLKEVSLPRDLDSFRECMENADFKEYFPDVKKRIFAVVFYLDGKHYRTCSTNLTKEEVFAAAKTLNSLEKSVSLEGERLIREYRDYLRMHRTYRQELMNMQENGPLRQEVLDWGVLPVNVKPSKIRDYHTKMVRVVNILKHSKKIARYAGAVMERKEKDAQKYEYTNGKYSILLPKDAMEIIHEGRELQHCVGSAGYIQMMAKNYCTILFLRNNQDIDKPLITIEECGGRIRQCYGFRNSYNHNAEVRDFIMDYAALQEFKIEAVIFEEE